MSHFGSYEDRIKDFDWSLAEKELEYNDGDVINIGWYCTDRICQMGKGHKTALLWEGFGGAEKKFTFDLGSVLKNQSVRDRRELGLPAPHLGQRGITELGSATAILWIGFSWKVFAIHATREGTPVLVV